MLLPVLTSTYSRNVQDFTIIHIVGNKVLQNKVVFVKFLTEGMRGTSVLGWKITLLQSRNMICKLKLTLLKFCTS